MTDTDIAVVGGGIVGCLIAREVLSRSPGTSVTVLDRDAVGSGASRRSAGVHFPRGATQRVRDMTAVSQDYYAALKASDDTLPIYPLATSVLSRDADAVREAYLASAALTQAQEVPGGLVAVPDGAGAWNAEGSHYADVGVLAGILARRLRAQVCFREGVAVTGVEHHSDAVVLRLGTGGSLRAKNVVLATGPWVRSPAWQSIVDPLGVRVKLVVALHIHKVPTGRDRLIVFQDPDAFLLPMAHRGHWLFSYTSQHWDVQPDALTEGLTGETLAEGREVLAAYAPDLADVATAGRVFCDAYSPNREPLVRALDPHARIVFAGAANGSGYRLAPAIAAEAADLLRVGQGQRISA